MWNWEDFENAKIVIEMYYYDYERPTSIYNGILKFNVTTFHFTDDYPKIAVDTYDLYNTTKMPQDDVLVTLKLLHMYLNDAIMFADNFVQSATNLKSHIV